jgi:hypothetical protein
LGKIKNVTNKTPEAVLGTSEEDGLEVNAEKTKHKHNFLS